MINRTTAPTDPDGWFDERIAAIYDRDAAMFSPAVVDPAVDRLQALAAGGPALEFAIGTGRIGLPLAARGVPVSGIECSRAMLARLRAKPGGTDIPVILGDMTSATVEGSFSLVYLVFNTINNLTTQAAQVACFRNAASHLQPGGVFVVEVGVPRLQRLPEGERLLAFTLDDDHWGIDEYDIVEQGLVSHHMRIVDGTVHTSSTPFRYVWPSELDLMAELAGLRLRERRGGWCDEPFTGTGTHVSVWALG